MSGSVVVPVTDPTAIESGNYWNGIEQATGSPIIVTFSFPTTLPTYDTNATLEANGFGATTGTSFVPFSAAEQAEAITALGAWAAMSGLVFLEVAPGQGDINFSNVNFNTTSDYGSFAGVAFNPFGAWNYSTTPYFYSDLDISGDVFMNTNDQNGDGTVNMATLLHEIGHAIGLKHPDQVETNVASGIDHNQVLSAADQNKTIMTENSDANGGPGALQNLDTLAAQAIYGSSGGAVVTSTTTIVSGSDSVSNWSWNPTTQTLTQTARLPNETVHGTSVNDIINGLAGDTLIALDGTDMLIGAGGGDTLVGGPGTDTLIGGPGGNVFNVNSAATTVDDHLNPGGTDTVYATVNFTLPTNTNTLYISGSSGLIGTGNSQHDYLYDEGSPGSTLIGGTGGADLYGNFANADTLIGEAGGINNFHVYSAANTVIDNNTVPGDEVFTEVSMTLPANVTQGAIFGVGLTLTANGLDDSLYGDPNNATTLIGGPGNDYILGQAGHDTIVAGTGTGYFFDSAGNNTFVFKTLADAKPGPNLTAIYPFDPASDKIDLSGIAASTGQALTFSTATSFSHTAGQVIEVNSGGNTIIEGDTTGAGLADFEILLYADPVAPVLTASNFIMGSTTCFLAGTFILTDRGEIPIQDLVIGDQVITISGAPRPIRWIGKRAYGAAFARRNPAVWPVRIGAGALADGIPARDLFVSPNHAMFLDGVLIEAALLVNGTSVTTAAPDAAFEYFNVEFDSHDVILAEGAPAETFLDRDCRAMFQNAQEYCGLYPDAIPDRQPTFFALRVIDGATLEAVRNRLDARAGVAGAPEHQAPGRLSGALDRADHRGVAGWVIDVDRPGVPVLLDVLVDGVPVARLMANRYRNDLTNQGNGTGQCSFELIWPVPLDPYARHVISLHRVEDAMLLPQVPAVLEAAAPVEAIRLPLTRTLDSLCVNGDPAELDDMVAVLLGGIEFLLKAEADRAGERDARATRFWIGTDTGSVHARVA